MEFTLPAAANVSLVVYDIPGREVVSMANGTVVACY
jgi:hypothetical protein